MYSKEDKKELERESEKDIMPISSESERKIESEKIKELPPIGMKSTSRHESDIKMIQERRPNKTNDVTSENPIDSYVPLNGTLLEEFSTELRVLSESTELLHGQTKELLKKPDSEARKIDHYNIEQARANMNTIAKLIQTKINFAKVLK